MHSPLPSPLPSGKRLGVENKIEFGDLVSKFTVGEA